MVVCSKCGAELEPPYRFCSKCGQPGVASPPYPAYGYPPPMVLPPRDNSHTIILLVVVIIVVLVAVPAVLAAILYTMTSGLIDGYGPAKPIVTMTLNTKTASSADILVTGSQPAVSAANYKVNVEVGSAFGTAVALPASGGIPVSVFVGAGTYMITWENPGGSGTVIGGDTFNVSYPGGSTTPPPGTMLSFLLIWADGSTISTISWQA